MDRRLFLKSGGLAVAGLALGNFIKIPKAFAAECTASDAVAAALGYVSVAANIDKKKYPQFKTLKKGQDCQGCSLYKATSGGMGKCTMLANCEVAGKGLCGSWQKKA